MLPDIKTILYASDVRSGSRPAFRMAVKLAVENNATIVFLHACEPFDSDMQDQMQDYLPKNVTRIHTEQILEARQQRISERIQDFLEEELDDSMLLTSPPQVVIRTGKPNHVILATAKEFNADLIVMGDRATSTLSRMFLGSTSQNVVHQSPTPVLIVPLTANNN